MMKKLLFLALFIMLTATNAFAQDESASTKDDGYSTSGVYLLGNFSVIPSYTFSTPFGDLTSDDLENTGLGGGLTVGYLTNFGLAVEASFDYNLFYDGTVSVGGVQVASESISSTDYKLFALYQPSFGFSMLSLMPYVGGGAMISSSRVEIIGLADSGTSFGLGGKAGLRLNVLFLLFDIGLGYDYRFPTDGTFIKDVSVSDFAINFGIGVQF